MDEKSILLGRDDEATADKVSEKVEEKFPKHRNAKVLLLEQQLNLAGFGFFHVLLITVSGLAMAADSVEIFGVSFVVPIADKDLELTTVEKGWLDASIFIGMMIGGYMWGSLSDVFGRRKCLVAALLVNGVSAFVSAFSLNFYFFLAFRFASGIGVGGSLPVVFSYVSEFFTEKQRGPIVILLAMCWQPGIIFTALLALVMMGIPEYNTAIDFYIGTLHFVNWRLFLIICTIPAFLCTVLIAILPETPAYLYLMGRYSVLQKVLRRVHNTNSCCPCCWTQKINNTETSFFFDIEEQVMKLEGADPTDAATSTDPSNTDTHTEPTDTAASTEPTDTVPTSSGHTNRLTPWRSNMITNKAKKVLVAPLRLFRLTYLRATLLLLVIWFSQCYGYYGLQLWFPEYFKRLELDCLIEEIINGTLPLQPDNCSNATSYRFYQDTLYTALATLPGNLLGVLLINIIGARVQLVATMSLAALSVFSIWKAPSIHVVVLSISCIFSAVTVTVFGTLDFIEMNVYDTSLRGTAFGIHSGIGRIGAILGNVTFGNLIDANIALPILLVASVLAVGAVASIFLPSVYRPENRPPLYRAVAYMYRRCCKRQQRDFNPRVKEKTQTYGTISTTSFIDTK